MELPYSLERTVDPRPIPFGTEGLRAALLPAEPGSEALGRQGEAERVRVIRPDGQEETFRLQDYPRLYSVPGLYDAIVHDRLKCLSPDRVASQLVQTARAHEVQPGDLRVLDIAAGNGFSGKMLAKRGVGHIVGTDYFEEARTAAGRDRPGTYDDYLVGDIRQQRDIDAIVQTIKDHELNAMTCAGALGHLPFDGFVKIWEAFRPDTFVAVSFYDALDESVLPMEEHTEFTDFLRREIEKGRFALQVQERYVHRKAMDGGDFLGAAVAGRILVP